MFELGGPTGLAVRRELFVGRGLEETSTVGNRSDHEVEAVLELELASDFADIFAVKRVEDLGAPGHIGRSRRRGPSAGRTRGRVEFADDGLPGADARASRACRPTRRTEAPRATACGSRPASAGSCVVAVQWLLNGTPELDAAAFEAAAPRGPPRAGRVARRLVALGAAAAGAGGRRRSSEPGRSSLADLAALRLRWAGSGMVPAAGLPWFMTLFGRDTLITSFQELVARSRRLRPRLRALAEAQADVDDPERDAEPGKIVHELRRGKTAIVWTDRYYGTIDATPLFLVLLSSSGAGAATTRSCASSRSRARVRSSGSTTSGDRDGDGFVEYLRRATHGIDNQNWKDSYNSMVFHDGSLARAPIAPVEVQGYVYDAKLRVAELARRVWGDEATGRCGSKREAAELRERFDAAFWLPRARLVRARPRRATSGRSMRSRPTWAICSGAASFPQERVARGCGRLVSGPLWSGWGVRTLAADEPAFDPLEYHNGTVWPHDNSLIALGLAQAGRRAEAEQVVRALLDCAPFFEYRLPELFAGATDERRAAGGRAHFGAAAGLGRGTPLLLLRAQLGLEPDPAARMLRVTTTPSRPGSRGSRSTASPPSTEGGACASRIARRSSSDFTTAGGLAD